MKRRNVVLLIAMAACTALDEPNAAGSENSTIAGTRFRGVYIAVRRSSRTSGTFEMPIAASPLPWDGRASSLALVMS